MTTTPQAALLREAAQNALITLDGIASANPRDKADFETPAEWITWAKSRARWAADALREPVAQEVYAERILKQMLREASEPQAEKKCGTCGFIGQEDPVKGCPKCGFDDMRDKLQATQAEPAQAGELPPLPEPEISGIPLGMPMSIGNYIRPSKDLFTADQMHAYARAALSARKPLSVDRIHQIGEALADGSYGPVGGPMESYQFETDTLVDFVRFVERAHGIGLEVKP